MDDCIDPATDLTNVFTDANAAALAIPPAWPLAATVAVNPFLGQTRQTLPQVAARLARTAGARVTMPRAWYRERMEAGVIADADILAAIKAVPEYSGGLAAIHAALAHDVPPPRALPTIADLAAEATGIDWPAIIAERFGAWAAGWCDQGQALWAAPKGRNAYAAWRAVATHDLTPEIIGLKGFPAFIADAPEGAAHALVSAAFAVGIHDTGRELYFHRLLTTIGGWAHYARYHLFQAQLTGGSDDMIVDFLAIRLLWEQALLDRFRSRIGVRWMAAMAEYATKVAPGTDDLVDAVLQTAAECAAQRELAATLALPATSGPRPARPALQAAFCIDVRSEPFRRALESIDRGIETLGFAGFFGIGAAHRSFASDTVEHRLPVLLNPAVASCAGGEAHLPEDRSQRHRARANRAWARFKMAAVSSFAFVEAAGPLYVGKLIGDALGLRRIPAPADPAPRLDPEPDMEKRIDMAASVLRAMSLHGRFAPLVLLLGHGAGVTNNPHASALHCGACGGHSGEVNARLLAALLNDPAVREGLARRNIAIPADTLFVAGLHDTTSDQVTLYPEADALALHAAALRRTEGWLDAAGKLVRTERALRFPQGTGATTLPRRGRDWAQVRPEWGLAGCSAFIAAPRQRTAGKPLAGRAFLHDYDWRKDDGFAVLELIMTAPVVVASWISLQYYGSTVAPYLFGGGNKLLHNVVGGFGVIEGNGGVLRTGLPWQSVHDGETYVHDPLRLSVCIEAPCEAMTDILSRHPDVRTLFDNGWLSLFALNEKGQMTWRYIGELQWETMDRHTLSGVGQDIASHSSTGWEPLVELG
jgi:uncharacterized protein YbcC (UPF0753/DUF2309 family)